MGTDPRINHLASVRLGEPSRWCTIAPPDLYTAAAVRSAVTTVAASPTPRKMRAGVISAPPPMPVRPTTTPTKKPAAMIEKNVTVIRSSMGGPSGRGQVQQVGERQGIQHGTHLLRRLRLGSGSETVGVGDVVGRIHGRRAAHGLAEGEHLPGHQRPGLEIG